jgi:hypothetical protein
MEELLQQHKPKVIVAAIIIVLAIAGFFWYDNSQTKEYVQSIQYDVQSLNQSRTTLEGYEKGGLTFIAFFENTDKVGKDIAKAKENLARSTPKNNASHTIKKAALDYADAVTKMCDSANDWRDYEMRNRMNKAGIDKVQKNYYGVKDTVQPKYNAYANLVK